MLVIVAANAPSVHAAIRVVFSALWFTTPYLVSSFVRLYFVLASARHRMLDAVFRKSGVPDVHSHRFRHTLAAEMLAYGATYEDVAAVLGNSPAIVRKHYARWSRGRELRLAHFLEKVRGEPAWFKKGAEARPYGLSQPKRKKKDWCGEGDSNS